MFQFTGSLPDVMDWRQDLRLNSSKVSIRRSPDRWVFALPKLSQLITSFIALGAKASTIRSYQHNQNDSKDPGMDLYHTCIALHALVIGQFILSLFFFRLYSNC